MPLDPIPGEDHARSLLLEALKQAEIEEHTGNPAVGPFNGTNVYWQQGASDIELRFYCNTLGMGRMSATISLLQLAMRTIEFFQDDDESVTSTLVDVLRHLKTTISHVLPMTEIGIIKRAENLYLRSVRTRDPLTKAAILALFALMTPSYHDHREESETNLRAERNRRGGSQPKLPEDKRKSLHQQYSSLHKLAKTVKKDYEAKLKEFGKRRRARGYTHEEWRAHWMNEAHKYPDEIQKYLELFAELDSPAASDVAYRILAAKTGHKKSYLERLVADSRRASKSSTLKPD